MTTPDPTLAARLAELRTKATDDDLADQGHHFGDESGYSDLTNCNHGECGYFCHRGDGPLIAALWNAYRSGQLITLADAEAMVRAENEACAKVADYAGVKQMPSDGSYSHHEPVMGPDVATDIRARVKP